MDYTKIRDAEVKLLASQVAVGQFFPVSIIGNDTSVAIDLTVYRTNIYNNLPISTYTSKGIVSFDDETFTIVDGHVTGVAVGSGLTPEQLAILTALETANLRLTGTDTILLGGSFASEKGIQAYTEGATFDPTIWDSIPKTQNAVFGIMKPGIGLSVTTEGIVDVIGGGVTAIWGNLTGTLADQTDLTTYVGTQISALVDSAPATLDTLNELAAALGDDPNFATTTTNLIGTKEPIIVAGTTLQYWRGDKTFQTLNTAAVPELTNLYYTDARVATKVSKVYVDALGINATQLGSINAANFYHSGNSNISTVDWTTANLDVYGAIGIGTTSPTYQLHIKGLSYVGQTLESISGNDSFISFEEGTNVFKVGIDASTDVFKITRSSFNGNDFNISQSTGNVLIGTTTNSGYKLDVNGTGRFTGALTVASLNALGISSAQNSFIIKNSSGVTKWTINLGASDVLEFKNAANALILTVPQTGAIVSEVSIVSKAGIQAYTV